MLLVLAAVPVYTAAGQEIDPFYLKMFESGEKLFLAKDYAAAVKDLEIAAFGIGRDRKLSGKAYLYLAVCQEAMRDRDKSREALAKAAGLLGADGVQGLGLDGETIAKLKKISDAYGIALALPAGVQAESTQKPPAQTTATPTREADAKAKGNKKAAAGSKEGGQTGAATQAEKPLEKPVPKVETTAKTGTPEPAKPQPETKRAQTPDVTKKPARTESKPEAKATPERKTTSDQPASKPESKAELKKKPESGQPEKPVPSQPTAEKARADEQRDLKALEEQLKHNPGDPALAYELVPVYFKLGNYRSAQKILEAFLARAPRETRAVYLLAKSNFFLRDYRAALDGFRQISSPAWKPALDRDLGIRTALYTSLCLTSLGKPESASTFMDYVVANTSAEERERLLADEGLTGYRSALRLK